MELIGNEQREDTPYFVIRYEKGEWEKISQILSKKLNLTLEEVHNGWGTKKHLFCYKEKKAELKNLIINSLAEKKDKLSEEGTITLLYKNNSVLLDDINKPLLVGGNRDINIAFFRVLPQDDEVAIRLERYLTSPEIEQIKNITKQIYHFLMKLEVGKKVKL
jgi:hypothetical protein